MEKEYHVEVDFNTYCKTCKHEKLDEQTKPCFECLESPVNLYSNRPVQWEEK